MKFWPHLAKYEVGYIIAVKLVVLMAISCFLIQPNEVKVVPDLVSRHLFSKG